MHRGQFYNTPFPNARSKKRKGSHWLLTPVDLWKADTIMLRNDFTYNMNRCGDDRYAGVLSRGHRLPIKRQCTLDGGGGGLLKKFYDMGVRTEP